eukprot:TRINITY_DN8836_c0_g1_i1.p1 TRINITY_DN8836_c0_g1~~TRINITY_DN8836_c0_g1_i1.p1  ORF type:complete len:486 (+),score=148.48 TRINITY_DN8836_c0_g1_i1:73-1458(+)
MAAPPTQAAAVEFRKELAELREDLMDYSARLDNVLSARGSGPRPPAAGVPAATTQRAPADCVVCLVPPEGEHIKQACCGVTVCLECLAPFLLSSASDFRFLHPSAQAVCPTQGCEGGVAEAAVRSALAPEDMRRFTDQQHLWLEHRASIEAARFKEREAMPFSDDLSQHYLQSRCRQCPSCQAWIEKEAPEGSPWHGCDKMTCRCGARFCFRCNAEEGTCSCTSDVHLFFTREEVLASYRQQDAVAEVMNRVLGQEMVGVMANAITDGPADAWDTAQHAMAARPDLSDALFRELRNSEEAMSALHALMQNEHQIEETTAQLGIDRATFFQMMSLLVAVPGDPAELAVTAAALAGAAAVAAAVHSPGASAAAGGHAPPAAAGQQWWAASDPEGGGAAYSPPSPPPQPAEDLRAAGHEAAPPPPSLPPGGWGLQGAEPAAAHQADEQEGSDGNGWDIDDDDWS